MESTLPSVWEPKDPGARGLVRFHLYNLYGSRGLGLLFVFVFLSEEMGDHLATLPGQL